MNFGFLYDRKRQLFSIGYRLADAGGPGGSTPRFYDLLASEARLASFFAIAKGDVPETPLVPPRAPGHERATARPRCCRGARRCSST